MKAGFALCAIFCFLLSGSVVLAATGGGDLKFAPKGAKSVFFSHKQHVEVKTLKCSACHYHTFQMSKDSYKMEMGKITKGEFCGLCHNGKRSFDVMDEKSCERCHR